MLPISYSLEIETTAVAVGQPILADLEEGEARFVSYQVLLQYNRS